MNREEMFEECELLQETIGDITGMYSSKDDTGDVCVKVKFLNRVYKNLSDLQLYLKECERVSSSKTRKT